MKLAIFITTILLFFITSQASDNIINNWKFQRKANENDMVKLLVMLKHSAASLELLEERFWAVSTPSHEDYGKFLSKEELKKIMRIPTSSVRRVVKFFQSYEKDIKIKLNAYEDALQVEMNSVLANEIFKTKMNVYKHVEIETASDIIRTMDGYTLPLPDDIEFIGNLEEFPNIWMLQSEDNNNENNIITKHAIDANDAGDWPISCGKCANGLFGKRVTPAVLTAAYHLGNSPNGTAKGSIAVAEFTQVYWDQEDLDLFASECQLKNISIDMHGDNKPSQCHVSIIIRPNLCKEALLDIETIKGIAGSIPLSNYYTDQYSILDWSETINALDNPPLVHSVSYGNDETQQSSVQYMYQVNIAMQKLGVRGLTILFASGDDGVYGRRGSGKRFHPSFPATSPYVTSVGGTNFATPGTIGAETAWSGSGGGFSDTFGIPKYQADAVAAYKKTPSLPDQSKWNNTGRGFPDVAALGGQHNQYCITLNNNPTGAYGTSAATPVWGAVVAKLNEIRLAKGKSPMGFMNPFLYENPSALNDVTTGCNGK
jgi:tripeptidyl-peptidase I